MDGGAGSGMFGRPQVLVIGGGASGVLMAAHLLRRADVQIEVTLLERTGRPGRGIAYDTDDPDHLLNTRVAQMSAFPDAPADFERWLQTGGRRISGADFVDRGTYGRYLESLLAPWRSGPDARRLTSVQAECLRLSETAEGVSATLDDGRVLRADCAILATGHAVPAAPPRPLRGAWDFTPPDDPMATVTIIGTGLSMVDHVATLLRGGHRGPIYCLSRRGLLPQEHAATPSSPCFPPQIPLGAPVSQTLHWLRGLVRLAEAQGGSWRDAVDAIRPRVAQIWQSWPQAERARFLRHAASWWEVHRHRMPPASAERIFRATASGQLRILRGSFVAAQEQPDRRIVLAIAPRRGDSPDRLVADHVIDCRGIRRDPARHAAPVIRDLLARGAARLDPLGLGLDTTPAARVIDTQGTVSKRVFAIGPAARGALWEITAIPDIREQTSALARACCTPSETALAAGE